MHEFNMENVLSQCLYVRLLEPNQISQQLKAENYAGRGVENRCHRGLTLPPWAINTPAKLLNAKESWIQGSLMGWCQRRRENQMR